MSMFSNPNRFGCGDPMCLQCGLGPKDKPMSFKGGPATGSVSEFVERARDDVMRMVREIAVDPAMLRSLSFETDLSRAFPPVSASSKQQISAAEQELRKKVEKYFLDTKHQVGWDDVIGNEAARTALLEAIEYPVRHKDLHAFYGMKPPKGVLLYGPPGCGKTLFGKAAASAIAAIHGGEEVPLLKINGPEIQTPFIGATEAIIRDIFAYARAFAKRTGRPLVIFVDEADALLPSRDGVNGRRVAPWDESQVAQFLTEMDGLETSGAFVILATNRPHAIDQAVLRDGRCDRKIKVERPDREAATAILAKALAGVPGIAPVVSDSRDDAAGIADRIAEAFFDPEKRLATIRHNKGTDFLTLAGIVNGAMLEGLVSRAKAIAFRRDLAAGSRSGLSFADCEAAITALMEENIRLDHSAAIEDFAETFDVVIQSVAALRWRAPVPEVFDA